MTHHRAQSSSWNNRGLLFFILFLFLTVGVFTPNIFHTGIIFIDQSVYSFLSTHNSPLSLRIMLEISHFADPVYLLLLQSAVLLFFLLKHRDRMGALFIGGIMTGEIVSSIAKNSFQRPRPGFVPHSLEQFTYAYPSGHALVSLLFYGFIAYLLLEHYKKHSQKIIIYSVSGTIIFLIGLSRIFLGVHWLSDVVGGWLLGGVLLTILISSVHRVHAWRIERRSQRHTVYIFTGVLITAISFLAAFYIALSLP